VEDYPPHSDKPKDYEEANEASHWAAASAPASAERDPLIRRLGRSKDHRGPPQSRIALRREQRVIYYARDGRPSRSMT
jgi:hypothetical protein